MDLKYLAVTIGQGLKSIDVKSLVNSGVPNTQCDDNITKDVIRFYHPTGNWGWLANFSPHSILIRGHSWKTVEHYFQAQKFAGTSFEWEVLNSNSAEKAKELAKSWVTHRRLDWETVRITIMYEAVRAKFTQHEELKKLLLATGAAAIIEDTEEDNFWGQTRCGLGLNMMGQLLMRLREELRAGNVSAAQELNETDR